MNGYFAMTCFSWLLLVYTKVTDFCDFIICPVTMLIVLINCNHFPVSWLVFPGYINILCPIHSNSYIYFCFSSYCLDRIDKVIFNSSCVN